MKTKFSFWYVVYYVAFHVFAFDVGIKYFIRGVDFAVIPGFVEFVYKENTGIAFSLPVPIYISIVMTVALIFLGLYFVHNYFNHENRFGGVWAGLILGGALGNLFSRVGYGYVPDYMSLWFWPIFNLADLAIVIGAVAILWKFDKIVRSKN